MLWTPTIVLQRDCGVFFLFLHENTFCRYSLEAPGGGVSVTCNIYFLGEIRKSLCEYPAYMQLGFIKTVWILLLI